MSWLPARTVDNILRAIVEIGREDSCYYAFFICAVKIIAAVAEKPECGEHKYSSCTAIFKLSCNVYSRVAGGDHIVYDYNIATFNTVAEIFVRFYRVSAVDNYGVITAFIEHSEFKTEH